MSHIQCQKIIPAGKFEVFNKLVKPENLSDLLKDHIKVSWRNPGIELQENAEFLFSMSRFGVEQDVRFRVAKMVTGNQLSYHQAEGIFNSWVHTIRFEDHGDGGTLVTDLVEYELPFGLMGRIADDVWLRNDLKQILEDRLERCKKSF
jgi:ligand-binding SRPBCC domain-containing protein